MKWPSNGEVEICLFVFEKSSDCFQILVEEKKNTRHLGERFATSINERLQPWVALGESKSKLGISGAWDGHVTLTNEWSPRFPFTTTASTIHFPYNHCEIRNLLIQNTREDWKILLIPSTNFLVLTTTSYSDCLYINVHNNGEGLKYHLPI